MASSLIHAINMVISVILMHFQPVVYSYDELVGRSFHIIECCFVSFLLIFLFFFVFFSLDWAFAPFFYLPWAFEYLFRIRYFWLNLTNLSIRVLFCLPVPASVFTLSFESSFSVSAFPHYPLYSSRIASGTITLHFLNFVLNFHPLSSWMLNPHINVLYLLPLFCTPQELFMARWHKLLNHHFYTSLVN